MEDMELIKNKDQSPHMAKLRMVNYFNLLDKEFKNCS